MMSQFPDTARISRLATDIERRYGLMLPPHRFDQLTAIVTDRRSHLGMTLAEYVAFAATGSPDELEYLASALTVPETYFFRHDDHFRALTESVVPTLLAHRGRSTTVRIWSAGCCTGEEPYSISMILQDRFPGLSLEVLATDLNDLYLERARTRIYRRWSLRSCPERFEERWFHDLGGGHFEVAAEAARPVRLFQHNLVSDALPDIDAGLHNLDAIFCRNVLMYFSPDTQRRIVRRLTRCLAPGGYLFLGHAEWSAAEGMGLVSEPGLGGAAYRRGEPTRRAGLPGVVVPIITPVVQPDAAPPPRPLTGPVANATPPPTTQRATERMVPDRVAPPSRPAPVPAVDDLIKQADIALEADDEAAAVSALDEAVRRDPWCTAAQHRLARIAADRGDYKTATYWCDEALMSDPLCGDAVFVRALVALAGNDTDGAVHALRQTLFLEPDHIGASFHLVILQEASAETAAMRKTARRLGELLDSLPDDAVVADGSTTAGFIRQWLARRVR